MQKKIIALALAAAFSAPAFADNANVTVYGKAIMTFDQAGSDATGAVSQMRVNTNASRLGVKGSEDLGNDLKALYQYEVQVDADGNGKTGFAAGTRNSGLGLEGGFGKVMVGVWDTPFKVAHNKIELFDNTTSWTSTAVIGRSAGKDFNTRQANMLQYWSPKISGLQAAVMFSPDEAKTATVNKSILSMSGTFELDNIYASVAYESRADATTTTTTDSALRAVANYNLGDFAIGALAESIKTNTGLTTSVTGKNVELVGQYKLGTNHFAVSYAKQGSTAVAPAVANDINQLSLKYAYNFSKRTELFGAYTSNKANAATSVTKTFIGGGIVHSF
jgi:predicted porin